MEPDVTHLPGSSLSLSTLRLLVPPIRLVSAAIWQTLEQKIVVDYGLLEEFVFMVTEIVPQLLSTRQRAELILGLRARLILELCRSDDTANLQVIQPHLDRMQSLRSLWSPETEVTETQESDSHFLGLVRNLLQDPEQRRNFFQDIFPGEFGPTYDKAIQTLMWLFLSRLEKLLPSQTLQQIASSLTNTSSVLGECMEALTQPQELQSLLDSYKDLGQLEDIDSCVVDSGILSALCLPTTDQVMIVNDDAGPDVEGGLVYTVCTEMEVESETNAEDPETSDKCEQAQWFGAEAEPKVEADAVDCSGAGVALQTDTQPEERSETLMIGADGQVTVLDNAEKKPVGRRGRKKKRPADEEQLEAPSRKRGTEEDPDFVLGQRPVRKNRGLKMKGYLSQWKRSARVVPIGAASTSGGSKTLTRPAVSNQSSDVDKRTCKVCGLVVRQVKYLEPHLRRHARNLPVTCQVCKKFFKTTLFLQQHKCSNVTEKKPDGNPNAPQTDEDKGERSPGGAPGGAAEDDEEQLVGDLEEDKDGGEPSSGTKSSKEDGAEDAKSLLGLPLYCPHCSAEFKCRQTFRFHMRNICYVEQQVDPELSEGDKRCFRCDECGKAFKYRSTLESHRQTHNPLYCEMCMKLVRDSDALAMHKESHTPFQCNQCEESFPVFKALHKHYIDTHSPSEPYTCTYCQLTFTSLKRFIRHEWKHTGYQPFQCTFCTKRFRSYSDLVEHQKKHTKAYPFLCWECGKKFRHGATLTRHVERVHSSGEPIAQKPLPVFPCSQCDKTFTSRRCLLKHDNFHHKGMRFPCEHCGKGFFGKDALVRHILIHTGERPFKCDDCDKSFRSSAELKIHRRYHTGERPFKCNVCEKGFVQSCFLTLHMRTHTGERPYVCAVCNKGFSSLHGLKRHGKLVHA